MDVGLITFSKRKIAPYNFSPIERTLSVLLSAFSDNEEIRPGIIKANRKDHQFEGDGSSLEKSFNFHELLERASEYDIVHIHLTEDDVSFLPAIARINRPIVLTLHFPLSYKTKSILSKYSERFHCIVPEPSEEIKNLQRVKVIPSGIDVNEYPNSADIDIEEFFIFIFHSHSEKELHFLNQIAEKINNEIVLIGDIPFSYSLPHNVQYGDRISQEEKKNLLSRALGLIYLPTEIDLWKFDLIEAMACGTPVLALDNGGENFIVEGRNGFIVKEMGAIGELIPQLKRLDRRAIKEEAQRRFSLKRISDAHVEVYKEALRTNSYEDKRPWGYYEVLSDKEDHKVKRIVVFPGKRLSLQKHKHREEHWYIVEGAPIVTLNEDRIELKSGDSIDIPKGAIHRIENPGKSNVIFIEVQRGDYFGEDDIIRIEDDFGRK